MYANEASKETSIKSEERPHNASTLPRQGCGAAILPPLIAALYQAAAASQEQLTDVAASLGVTVGYLAQLQTGIKRCDRIAREFAEAVGRYLGIPTVLVYVLAGAIRAEDFIFPALVNEMDNALLLSSQGCGIGAMMPESMLAAAPDAQAYMLLLFQEAKQALMEHQRRLPLALHELMLAALRFQAMQNENS